MLAGLIELDEVDSQREQQSEQFNVSTNGSFKNKISSEAVGQSNAYSASTEAQLNKEIAALKESEEGLKELLVTEQEVRRNIEKLYNR